MKIQTVINQPIESQGISGQGNFSIKTSGHAFRLLSSGLYTNKVQAVIRELSCNAADAHVLNGNQAKPFDIKLPNPLDGQFYVRDYGPGLSEQDVMSLYTTYFESTKQNSNDFTGGFGVGSKSPFAYTDMFTVVSVHEGMKGTYTAYVDDDGEPKLAKLGDAQPCDEPSGLSVGFPVKPEDQKTFMREADNVLTWFKSPVNVLGVSSNDTPSPYDAKNVLFRTKNIVMFGNKNNSYGGVSFQPCPGALKAGLGIVVMGNVHYPLPMDDCIKDLPQAQWFATHNAVYKVPIGSVSVAASREALAFDKFTKANIVNILTNAFNDVAAEVWKLIQEKTKTNSASNALSYHQAARDNLTKFGMDAPTISAAFMDAINATPEQRQLFEPRYLEDLAAPLQTFKLIKLDVANRFGSSGLYNTGDPLQWAKSNQYKTHMIESDSTYMFIENGVRAYGDKVNAALTAQLAGLKGPSSYRDQKMMLVPNEDADPVHYEREKKEWMAYLGVEPIKFTRMGEKFKNEGIQAMNPFEYHTPVVELLPATPPFFWLTQSEFTKLGGNLSNRHSNYNLKVTASSLKEVQKNLGIKEPIERFYVVPDKNAAELKKLCPNAQHVFEDFALKTLLSPKIQKKIGSIKPMMANSSSTFSTMRGKLRREKEWEDTLKDSKIGSWIKQMDRVKGSMSFDYTTMKVLVGLKEALGVEAFPSIIPEYYDGYDVQKKITKDYPFLEINLAYRVALNVEQLGHLKSYVAWCEANGSAPPGQSALVEDSPAP